MSEKELGILQNIQYAIDNYDKFEFGDFDYDDIKGLLDLYIKEKNKFSNFKSKTQEILDKAECMDYYSLVDVIEDLEKLVEEDK
jgi:hypothetical protein